MLGSCRHDITREKGESALHLAALAGEPECVLALLRANASPGARDFDGNLPLHLAAFGARNCQQPRFALCISVADSLCKLVSVNDSQCNRFACVAQLVVRTASGYWFAQTR